MRNSSFLFARKPGIALGLAGLLAAQGLVFDAGTAHAGHVPLQNMQKARATSSNVIVSAMGEQTTGSPGLALAIGMTLNGDGSTCGTATTLVANVGDSIDFCYTVTNNSATAMAYSTLDDSVNGNVFTNMATAIPAGGSYTYHRNVVAAQSETHAATWTSRDILPGYTYNDTGATAFVDVSTTGTGLGYTGTGDDEITAVTIPFNFSFYGASSNQICVSNNGLIFFGVGAPCPTGGSSFPWFGNAELPASALPNAAILPYWDDFGNGPGDVFYATQGTAPARKFYVQWNGVQHYSTTPQYAKFEVVFDEATNNVSFEYNATTFGNASYNDGVSATVGLQQNATTANQYSYNTASLSAGKSIVWSMGTSTVLTATASTSLDVGAPIIGVNPTSINASASSGSTTPVNSTFAISNTGNRDLTWTIGEAPGDTRAHFPRTARHVAHKFDPSTSAGIDPASIEASSKLRALGLNSRGVGVLGAAGVPAFAFGGYTHTGDYLSLDMTVPGTLNVITTFGDTDPTVYAASFINNDFSKQYIIDDAGNFGTIDTATGVVTPIGAVSGAAGVTFLSMRWDSTNGNLYALGDDNHLYTINSTTGAATDVASISGPDLNATPIIINIAISPDGLMYAIELADDVLLAIDKTTGAATVIGSTGVSANYAQGMDFDPTTGILYWAGYQGGGVSNIYTVDLTTGAATAIGPVADGGELFGISIALSSSACSQPSDVPWLSVSPTSGTTTPGNSSNATVTLNPSGLVDGYYSANVCVTSNDPAHRVTSVPVEFAVGNVSPVASANPTSLAFSVESGSTDSDDVVISNVGSPGSHLIFTVTEAESDCGTPSDVAWLSESPTSGNVSVGGTPATLAVTVDSASLAVGTQTAVLCVSTNEPAHPQFEIPVTFTVTPTDLIFKDGFDPAQDPNIVTGTINQAVNQDGDGNTLDFVTGQYAVYSGSRVDDINLYYLPSSTTGTGPGLYVYWYGDAAPDGVDVGGVVDSGGTDFAVLHSGDVIGPSSTISGASILMQNWQATTDGYIGVAFYNEQTSAVNYGYLHITTTGPTAFPVQALEYAYNKVGDPITIP